MNGNIKNNNEEKTPSMEQILQNIRGVISGDENITNESEPLELTEIVNDDGSISSIKKYSENIEKVSDEIHKIPENVEEDVLDFIDNTLGITEQNLDIKNKENIKTDLETKPNESTEKINNDIPTKTPIVNQINSLENIVKSDKKVDKEDSLISDKTAAASSETLKLFAKAVSKSPLENLSFRSDMTIEELTIQVLKPYLKEWLDNNLHNIVKNLVEKEIQKLAPKDEK